MAKDDAKYKIVIHQSIDSIPREEWNNMTNDDVFPFLEWEWLYALEESGSISPETGWHPLHFCLYRDDVLKAAAPLYLRTGNGGDYIYDYFWAEAAESIGCSWYPKLIGMGAATPAEGYRFINAPDMDPITASILLLREAENISKSNDLPSVNILWSDPEWSKLLSSLDYTAWEHIHYVWENPGYRDFKDYLDIFSKNQRKNIRKEYASHIDQGIEVRVIPGEEAKEEHYHKMFEFFTITNDKFIPWDARWVNEEFFLLLEKYGRKRTAFVEAKFDNEIIAMAFLVHKRDRLWGRFWGAYEDIKDLHFTVCYYAPMDYCIKNNIRYFDPGAGSSHKIRRGFKAMTNKSFHKFFDPRLEGLFKANIRSVNRHEKQRRDSLNEKSPIKQITNNKE